MAWSAPDPTRFDALLLTSANAPRHAGAALRALAGLPVVAVGTATAAAARAAGLTVRLTGDRDAAALVAAARAQGFRWLIHLAGHDRVDLPQVDLPHVEAVTVYRSDALPLPPVGTLLWEGSVVLLHSARAARRFAELADQGGAARDRIAIAALSPEIGDAAGDGWAAVAVAERPTDAALVACVKALIDPSGAGVDKHGR